MTKRKKRRITEDGVLKKMAKDDMKDVETALIQMDYKELIDASYNDVIKGYYMKL